MCDVPLLFCVTRPIHIVWRDAFVCVTQPPHIVWRDSFIFVTWLIHICDVTKLYCVSRLIHILWRDSFIPNNMTHSRIEKWNASCCSVPLCVPRDMTRHDYIWVVSARHDSMSAAFTYKAMRHVDMSRLICMWQIYMCVTHIHFSHIYVCDTYTYICMWHIYMCTYTFLVHTCNLTHPEWVQMGTLIYVCACMCAWVCVYVCACECVCVCVCTHRNTTQHTARTHCSTQQHTGDTEGGIAQIRLTPQDTHWNTLQQHTATHCNTLQQHSATTQCNNTLQHTATHRRRRGRDSSNSSHASGLAKICPRVLALGEFWPHREGESRSTPRRGLRWREPRLRFGSESVLAATVLSEGADDRGVSGGRRCLLTRILASVDEGCVCMYIYIYKYTCVCTCT